MHLFNKKPAQPPVKISPKDPLEAAHDRASSAVGVFRLAETRLVEAIGLYDNVEQQASDEMARQAARLDEATKARTVHRDVLDKVRGLTGGTPQ